MKLAMKKTYNAPSALVFEAWIDPLRQFMSSV